MLLRAPATIFLRNGATVGSGDNFSGSKLSSSSVSPPSVIVCAAAKGGSSNNRPITGVVFEPFEEVKKELNLVPTVPQQSLARQKYADDSEAVINEQIKYVFYFKFSFRISTFFCRFLILYAIIVVY